MRLMCIAPVRYRDRPPGFHLSVMANATLSLQHSYSFLGVYSDNPDKTLQRVSYSSGIVS